MDMMHITNVLLKKLYKSNLDVELDLDLDSTVANAVQVQINVKPKYFNDFAFFYGTKDKKINYSSFFEVEDLDEGEAKNLFNNDKGIFQFFIVEEESNFVHLYGEIELEDLYDIFEPPLLNDSVFDEIINYLQEEHEITNYLKNKKAKKGDK